ncbi:MAG: YgeY family selenium metabolism-linked hydrolase [Euryarchaeota archaeon]|nr:YgeY family selenium metabolism-linked hydrolase [Euryarchaeota archaeon]|tara:strand:- start:1836 stop:3044 length:1209 start_codon:yes stop_codon:yes gene_type:complete
MDAMINKIRSQIEGKHGDIIKFLRDIIRIPSMDGKIGEVGERCATEMKSLNFDEVRFDNMGNILGRIGNGDMHIVFDSHIDTVGIGSEDSWKWDPFEGKIEDGVLFARGACDEKGSTPGMIYGMAIARDLGILDGITAWYFGNMEEWCDGIAPNAFVEDDPGIKPDFVIIGEPTDMKVYRGQKGRLEMEVVSKGRSAHAASNFLGDNAIYNILPVIRGVEIMDKELGDHEFLGKGRITVTDMNVKTASINAVPDEAVITIDRRMTIGEDRKTVLEQVRKLIPSDLLDRVTVREMYYDEPSYTGYVFAVDKYFPAWLMDDTHELCVAGQKARELIGLPVCETGKWDFSTNGIYWAGKANIPSIGFGPGDEVTAHTVDDSVRIDDVVQATGFYALIGGLLGDNI